MQGDFILLSMGKIQVHVCKNLSLVNKAGQKLAHAAIYYNELRLIL